MRRRAHLRYFIKPAARNACSMTPLMRETDAWLVGEAGSGFAVSRDSRGGGAADGLFGAGPLRGAGFRDTDLGGTWWAEPAPAASSAIPQKTAISRVEEIPTSSM